MNLLLDTATFLWWVTDDPSLSDRAVGLIRDPSRRVFLSAVSVWEIAVKSTLGKLPLPEDPATLVPRLRAGSGFEALPLEEEAVLLQSQIAEHYPKVPVKGHNLAGAIKWNHAMYKNIPLIFARSAINIKILGAGTIVMTRSELGCNDTIHSVPIGFHLIDQLF